jgi:ABC-type Fe3+/spermidine/putrescine transport system ATPase subunit
MLLVVKNISKTYTKGAIQALKKVSFEVGYSELVTIIGESGCGKSSLLKIIAGIEDADTGEVIFEGKALSNNDALIKGYRNIKMVFQDFGLMPNHTVAENIRHPIRLWQPDLKNEKVDELIRLFHLEETRNKFPRELSGGQQQRVAIARAIADEPALLLMDEPFSQLDFFLREQLKVDLRKITDNLGTSILLITHETTDALSFSDKMIVMREGEILQIGKPQTIYFKPTSIYVASFFGNINIFSAEKMQVLAPNTIFDDNLQYVVHYENIFISNETLQQSIIAKVEKSLFFGRYYLLKMKVGEVVVYGQSNIDYVVNSDVHISIRSYLSFYK